MNSIIEQRLDPLIALCRKYDVERLDLFGSAVRSDFDASRSDLDFVVRFSNFTVHNAADRFLGLMVFCQTCYDMQNAAKRIGRFVEGKSFDDYLTDELLRSGVERQFEIIGEAMTRLIKGDRATAERIGDYRKIAGFRNALIHAYDSIDDETSWNIIITKLPILVSVLQFLLTPPTT